jgi:hypothetical protein
MRLRSVRLPGKATVLRMTPDVVALDAGASRRLLGRRDVTRLLTPEPSGFVRLVRATVALPARSSAAGGRIPRVSWTIDCRTSWVPIIIKELTDRG